MAAPQASSRLEMLQARFQQRQLAEKEQKLLQLYDQQQLRAHEVAQRGSAGSNGSNSSAHGNNVSHQRTVTRTTNQSTSNSQGGGKVRQMFDERRQTKGIDKSYPLEPLENRSRKHTTATGNVNSPLKNENPTSNRRSIVTRRTAVRSKANGGKPSVSYHEEVSREMSDSMDQDNQQREKFTDENYQQASRYDNGRIDRSGDRHRTTGKINLTELNHSSVTDRTSDNLENDQFPEDEIIDAPDRLPGPSSVENKSSWAEARLEQLKNSSTTKIGQTTEQIVGNSFAKKRNETTLDYGSSSGASTVTRAIEKEIRRTSWRSPELEETEKPRYASPENDTGKVTISVERRSPIDKSSGITKVSQLCGKNLTDYYPRRKSEFEKSKTFRKLELELGAERWSEPSESKQDSWMFNGKQCGGKTHWKGSDSLERRIVDRRDFSRGGKKSDESSPERPGYRGAGYRESIVSNNEEIKLTSGAGIETSSSNTRSSSSSFYFSLSPSAGIILDNDLPTEGKTRHEKGLERSGSRTQSPIYRKESIVKREKGRAITTRVTSGEHGNKESSTRSSGRRRSSSSSSSSSPIVDHDNSKEANKCNEKNEGRKIMKSGGVETSGLDTRSSPRLRSSGFKEILNRDCSKEGKTSYEMSHQSPEYRGRSQSPNNPRHNWMMKNEERDRASGETIIKFNVIEPSTPRTSRLETRPRSPIVECDFSKEKRPRTSDVRRRERHGSRSRSQSPNNRGESTRIKKDEEREIKGPIKRLWSFESSTCSSRQHSSSSSSSSSSPMPIVSPNASRDVGKTIAPGTRRETLSLQSPPSYRRESIIRDEEGEATAIAEIKASRVYSRARYYSTSPTRMVDYDFTKEGETGEEKSPQHPTSREGSQSPPTRRGETLVAKNNNVEGGGGGGGKNGDSDFSRRRCCSSSSSSSSSSGPAIVDFEPSHGCEKPDRVTTSISRLVKKLARLSSPEKIKSLQRRKTTLEDIKFSAKPSNLRNAMTTGRSPEHNIVKKDRAPTTTTTTTTTTKQDESVKGRERKNTRDGNSPSPRAITRETVSFRAKKSERRFCRDDPDKMESTSEGKIDETTSGAKREKLNLWNNDEEKIRDESKSNGSSEVLDIIVIEVIDDSVESAPTTMRRFDSIEREHRVTVGVDETDTNDETSTKPSCLASNDKKIPTEEKMMIVERIMKAPGERAACGNISAGPTTRSESRERIIDSKFVPGKKVRGVDSRDKEANARRKCCDKTGKRKIKITEQGNNNGMTANSGGGGSSSSRVRERKRGKTSVVKKCKLRGESGRCSGGNRVDTGGPLPLEIKNFKHSDIEGENSTVVIATRVTGNNNGGSGGIVEIETINISENASRGSPDDNQRQQRSLGESKIDGEPTRVLRSIEDIRKSSIKPESQESRRELKIFNASSLVREDARVDSSSTDDNPVADVTTAHSISSKKPGRVLSRVRINKTLESGDREPVVKNHGSTVKLLTITRRVAKTPSPDYVGTKRSTTEGTTAVATSTLGSRALLPSSPNATSPDATNWDNRYGISELASPAGGKSSGGTSSRPGSRDETEFSTNDPSDSTDGQHPANNSQVTEIVSTITTETNNGASEIIHLKDDDVSGSKDNSWNRGKSSVRKQSSERSLASTPVSRPTSGLSTTCGATCARGGQSSRTNSKSKIMSTKTKSPTSSGPKAGTPSNPRAPPPAATDNDGLAACKICGRRFNSDRVTRHEQICVKTTSKKRKQFDAGIHRVKGTELEPFVKKGGSKKIDQQRKAQKPEVKSNWRRKHEDFINAIRSAKQVQAHLAAGGKLSDLPPPPPSDTSDYVQCPHCGRKFNQAAADRHVPKCQSMMHNKPNPRAPPKPKR